MKCQILEQQHCVLYTSVIDSTFHWKTKQAHQEDFLLPGLMAKSFLPK